MHEVLDHHTNTTPDPPERKGDRVGKVKPKSIHCITSNPLSIQREYMRIILSNRTLGNSSGNVASKRLKDLTLEIPPLSKKNSDCPTVKPHKFT